MKHCGPFMMDEASLSRAYQHVVEKKSESWGMATAYRYANSKKENLAANKRLEQDIRKMGYGFFKVEGHWQECQDPNINYTDCPKDKLRDSTEESLFVPNIKKEEMEKCISNKKSKNDSFLQTIILSAPEHNNHSDQSQPLSPMSALTGGLLH